MSLMSRVSPPTAAPVDPFDLLSAVGSTLDAGLSSAPPEDTAPATGAALVSPAGAAGLSLGGVEPAPQAASSASAASKPSTSSLRIIGGSSCDECWNAKSIDRRPAEASGEDVVLRRRRVV